MFTFKILLAIAVAISPLPYITSLPLLSDDLVGLGMSDESGSSLVLGADLPPVSGRDPQGELLQHVGQDQEGLHLGHVRGRALANPFK